ncbi:hypothetical protein C8R43DRAFT_943944 [Mycena crocata]|nr:hypothetical protein C8R43DRAFT_943944 [Mycena crocata]
MPHTATATFSPGERHERMEDIFRAWDWDKLSYALRHIHSEDLDSDNDAIYADMPGLEPPDDDEIYADIPGLASVQVSESGESESGDNDEDRTSENETDPDDLPDFFTNYASVVASLRSFRPLLTSAVLARRHLFITHFATRLEAVDANFRLKNCPGFSDLQGGERFAEMDYYCCNACDAEPVELFFSGLDWPHVGEPLPALPPLRAKL